MSLKENKQLLSILFIGLILILALVSLYIYPQDLRLNGEKTTSTISKPAAKAPTKIFNAESFELDNGMQVVVIPNHRAPVVTHMVWYKVGAADEVPGQSGIAHFLEHLMFKGTATIPPGEFSKRVKAMGGNDNAFTSQDYTAYYQSVASEHLETVMTMEADRMNGLIFPPDDVISERNVVLEERRQRTENDHIFL